MGRKHSGYYFIGDDSPVNFWILHFAGMRATFLESALVEIPRKNDLDDDI